MHRTLRLPQLARALTTSAPASASASAAASTSSSSSAGPAYTAPLKAGVLPAYDEALKYLAADKDAKLALLEKTRAQLGPEAAEKLEVEALANDPETRWRAANGTGQYQPSIGGLCVLTRVLDREGLTTAFLIFLLVQVTYRRLCTGT